MFELPKTYYPNGNIDESYVDDDDDVDDEDDQGAAGDTQSNQTASNVSDIEKNQKIQRDERRVALNAKRDEQKTLDARLDELKTQSMLLNNEEARAEEVFQKDLKPLCLETDLDAQMKRMQLNLTFLKGVDWNSKVLVLPDICVTSYSDERFKFDKKTGTIRMVTRDEYVKTFYNEISSKLWMASNRIYFYGCRGVGKSFLVYQLVCRLMCDDNNVVVYVPRCFEDIIFRTLRTLYVVCKSYGLSSVDNVLDDKEEYDLKTIIEKKRNAGYDSMFVLRIISGVKEALLVVNKRLILVIDQTNLIMSDEVLFKNQIKFVNTLQEDHQAILSGSANNEVSRLKIPKEFIKDVHPIFDKEEFLSFLVVKSMFKIIDQTQKKIANNRRPLVTTKILDQETVEEIRHMTGAIPIQINKFIDLVDPRSDTFPPFQQWSKAYQKKFRDENDQEDLKEWYNKDAHDDDDKKKILNNMLKCFMRRKITDTSDKYYDKRFVVLRKYQTTTDGSTADFLEPFSPCARTLLFSTYAGLLIDTEILRNFVNVIDSSIGGHDVVQGILLEQHLIDLMRLKVLKTFQIVSIDKTGAATSNNLKLENFEDVEFAGYLAPQVDPPIRNTLYIPLSKQYPAFDFVYYDYLNKAAYFVNVTKQKDAFDHIASNDRKAKAKKRVTISIKNWKENFLPANVKLYDVYLVLKKNFGINVTRKDWRECNVIYVEDLKQNNPVAHVSDHSFN